MKKIVKLLLMLTFVLSLTACGGEKKYLYTDSQTEELLKWECQYMFNVIADPTINDTAIEMLNGYNDDELAALANGLNENTMGAIKTEGKTIVNAVSSWANSLAEIGTPIPAETYDIVVKEDEAIIGYNINGSVHNAVVEFIFDKNLHITSITTNITYSFDECMAKAGINTAVGMGTVFVMLIVIMIIIYILGAVCGPKKAKVEEVVVEETVDKAIEAIAQREEDDTELIAVIAAAIAASEGASSTDGFVVRSIRKIR